MAGCDCLKLINRCYLLLGFGDLRLLCWPEVDSGIIIRVSTLRVETRPLTEYIVEFTDWLVNSWNLHVFASLVLELQACPGTVTAHVSTY